MGLELWTFAKLSIANVSLRRSQKGLKLSDVVIPLDGTQETLKILLGFCLKDGYEATRTDTNRMPLQIFHLVTELGENENGNTLFDS